MLWIFLGLALCSCKKDINALPEKPVKSATLIYMVADNNLSFFATKDLNEMEEGFDNSSSGDVYVYIDKGRAGTPSHPYLLKIQSDTTKDVVSKIIRSYPEQNSSDKETLSNVLNDLNGILKLQNSNLDNLVLWSHGSGWLPVNTSLYPVDSLIKNNVGLNRNKVMSFGLDEDDAQSKNGVGKEMEIQGLSQALKKRHFRSIIFDACYMGSLEVAYELRSNCDYLISSPAEISSTGFPYQAITKLLQSNSDPIKVAEKYSEYYGNQKGDYKSYTISVVATNQFENLARLIGETHALYKNDLWNISKTYNPPNLQQYDRVKGNLFYDAKDFYLKFLSAHNNDELLQRFNSLWSKAVLYESHSDKILGSLELKNVNGLSFYIPGNTLASAKINNYYKTLSWYETTNNNFWSY